MSNNIEINYKELLKVGEIYKNYKVLCGHFGEAPKKGNPQNAQIKEWKIHFNFTKQGHKITITDVYETPLDKIDNRKGGNNKVKYVPLLRTLLLDLLMRSESESIFLSKNNMLKALRAVNSNYTYGKRYPNRASKELKIDRKELDDFYEISDSMLQRNLDATIEILKDEALITCEMIPTVGVISTSIEHNLGNQIKGRKEETEDGFGDSVLDFKFVGAKHDRTHRRATKKEIDAIRNAERDALIALEIDSKKKIFPSGKNIEFYKLVNDKLFEAYSIYVYYKSYEISFNPDHIIDEVNKQKMLLDGYERLGTQVELNTDIIERMTLNAESRNRNATKKLLETGKSKYKMRTSFDYLDNNKRLVNNFISIEKDNLKMTQEEN